MIKSMLKNLLGILKFLNLFIYKLNLIMIIKLKIKINIILLVFVIFKI